MVKMLSSHLKKAVLVKEQWHQLAYADLEGYIEELPDLADRNDDLGIKANLREIVIEYTPQDAVFLVDTDKDGIGYYPQGKGLELMKDYKEETIQQIKRHEYY